MKVNIAVATVPGISSGNTTNRSMVNRLAPSIAAASSSDTGMAATKPCSIHNAKGKAEGRVDQRQSEQGVVSLRLIVRKIKNSGMMIKITGNTWLTRM